MKNSTLRNIICCTFLIIFMSIAFPVKADAFHLHIYRYDKKVSSTCTTKGYYQFKCRCGSTKKTTLKLANHNYTFEKRVSSTCTTEGYYQLKCKKCSNTKKITLKLAEHDNTTLTKAANCTEDGYTKTVCKTCNTTSSNTVIKATGHAYKTITKAATCTADGYTKTYCTKCNSVKENKKLTAQHTIVIDKAVAPTATKTGLTEGSHCSVCNKVITKQEVIPARGNYTWDGKTFTRPTKTEGDYLLITSPEELAWILKNKSTNGKTKIKLQNNIDMGNYTLAYFPATLKKFDGNNKTIKNLKINGNGLFGNSNGISVSNLTLDNIKVNSSSNAGILVGKLTGRSTFNCKIINSSVTTNKGNVGGFVGYIVRNKETDRSLFMSVTFGACSIENTTVKGSQAEGKFVGLLSGYDNNEILTFSNCSANKIVTDYSSYYVSKNQSVFLKATDSKNDGFLGNQKYYRGSLILDGIRFIPKWDGKTSVTPLLANKTYDGNNVTVGTNKFVVYSPFDLAGLNKKTKTPNAIYLKENIDMNGQGADGKYQVPSNFTKSKYTSKDDFAFTPFKTVGILDGNNKTIYNLNIYQPEKATGAFIISATGTTVHKNINFNNCQTVSTHKNVKTDAKAYGAILIATAGGSSYTMENVNATNCKVFALQKVGTLAGYVSANKSSIKNCKVENCYIENYKCNIAETFDSGKKKIDSSRWIRATATFYPQGEVGGMFGFVQNNATISNCKVNGTTVYAYGQNDKQATISGSRLGKVGVKALGYYLVPGRHVGTFIGDIRATGNVKITNCTVDSDSKATNRSDKHNNTYNSIGQAYYVKFLDVDGKKVTVNGNTLKLADCNRNTKR